ncbi:hypothetical protein AXG93_1089s1010 [Marchantia polymorpha subsp. ruderalis]|uniref:Uncharacterized protein n=1 Tax=Marchantia polymorpha subsp. ruderalis TaxID=1480154 RepID=A0A176WJ85_MARPO|nr:hypothetical protein AXG93_1089s1010 [Marchantia polymorpha subsp. ruderalis]
MLTVNAATPTSLAIFTNLANFQPLSSQGRNKCPGLLDRDPICDKGFNLPCDQTAEASRENLTISGQAKNSRSPWHPSNIIFATDYDVTCTIVDSCKVLVRAAEVAALKRPGKDIAVPWQPGDFLRDYKAALSRHAERTRAIVQTLFSEHKVSDKGCEASSCSPRSGRDSFIPQGEHEMKLSVKALSNKITDGVKLNEKLSPYREAELRMALTKLAMVEMMCNQDVNSLGVLRGPTREEIRAEAAVRVRLRANCSKVLQRLAQSGTPVHVVSANWSRDLIVGGLPKLPDDKLFIHSNDLVFDSAGRSLGIIDGKVVDAFDKEEVLRALRGSRDAKTFAASRGKSQPDSRPRLLPAPHAATKEMDDEGKSVLVYVGDSHTDLLGLLDADLGIVIGESLLMRRIMALFGIQLRPLAEASTRISVARVSNSMLSYRMSGYLFEARTWTDVETCLF